MVIGVGIGSYITIKQRERVLRVRLQDSYPQGVPAWMHLKGEPIRHRTIGRVVGIERHTGRDSHCVFYTGDDIHSLISHHIPELMHCIETHRINNGVCMLPYLLQY